MLGEKQKNSLQAIGPRDTPGVSGRFGSVNYWQHKTAIIDSSRYLCYIFPELENMGIKELKEKRDKIYALAAKYGAAHIRVFGSVATGKNRPDSDVDFLVDLAPERSLFDLGGLLMELHDLLNCEVDVVTEDGLRLRMRERILKEAILL